jgi:hypothetical protein
MVVNIHGWSVVIKPAWKFGTRRDFHPSPDPRGWMLTATRSSGADLVDALERCTAATGQERAWSGCGRGKRHVAHQAHDRVSTYSGLWCAVPGFPGCRAGWMEDLAVSVVRDLPTQSVKQQPWLRGLIG